jgi:hypothetical protein
MARIDSGAGDRGDRTVVRQAFSLAHPGRKSANESITFSEYDSENPQGIEVGVHATNRTGSCEQMGLSRGRQSHPPNAIIRQPRCRRNPRLTSTTGEIPKQRLESHDNRTGIDCTGNRDENLFVQALAMIEAARDLVDRREPFGGAQKRPPQRMAREELIEERAGSEHLRQVLQTLQLGRSLATEPPATIGRKLRQPEKLCGPVEEEAPVSSEAVEGHRLHRTTCASENGTAVVGRIQDDPTPVSQFRALRENPTGDLSKTRDALEPASASKPDANRNDR